MSKFDEFLKFPQLFSNGNFVVNGRVDREEAARQLSSYTGEKIEAKTLESGYVRFGFAPGDIEDLAGELCWYETTKGKGAMPVWILDNTKSR